MTDSDITICGHGSGNPSLKNLNTYSTQRYNSIASNGKHKGIVAVRRLKKLTAKKRKKFVKTYKTILGRNIYSNDLRQYVYVKYKNGKYYSDCSSSGMATMEQIKAWSGSWYLNTAAIYTSSDFETVPVVIKNGHIMNPEILQLGDAILFAGNDPARPLQIGHVEWVYEIPATDKLRAAKPTLRKGMATNEVLILQKDLNKLGIKDDEGRKLTEDSEFGPRTYQAVCAFQRTHEYVYTLSKKREPLEEDGIYGKKTYSAMKNALK